MMAALSYIGAHWALIVVVVLATMALGYLAFVLRNWKVALAAIVLVCAGLAYQSADLAGYKRRVNEESAARITQLESRIAVLDTLQNDNARRALADSLEISRLEGLASETPPNNGACFDAATSRRVRDVK
jgi:CBS-domain-containing membrane protein